MFNVTQTSVNNYYFSGLVVVTDGCIGVHDAAMFESILTQLRTSTISCTFLRVGDSLLPSNHFGHIAHTELMQFIATATFGAYFDSCPDVVSKSLIFILVSDKIRPKLIASLDPNDTKIGAHP